MAGTRNRGEPFAIVVPLYISYVITNLYIHQHFNESRCDLRSLFLVRNQDICCFPMIEYAIIMNKR